MSCAGWLWMLWVCASFCWAVDRSASYLSYLNIVMQFVALILIAGFVAQRPSRALPVLWAFAGGALLSAAVAFVTYRGAIGVTRIATDDEQGPAHFAASVMPAFLFLLERLITQRAGLLPRIMAMLAIVMALVAIMLSGTRSVWMGTAAGMLLGILPLLRRHPQAVGPIVVTLTSLALLLQAPGAVQFVSERAQNALTSGGAGRTDIWKVGRTIFAESPIVGVGYGNFSCAFSPAAVANTTAHIAHPEILHPGTGAHSVYLATAAELGFIGLAILLWWIAGLVIKLRRCRTSPSLPLTAILVGYLVVGAFLDILNRKYFWLAIALTEGVTSCHATHHPDRVTRSSRMKSPTCCG